MCVPVPIPFVQILLGNLWRAIRFTSLICTSERLLPLFLSPIRRRWSIASTQNVCIVPITHGLPLGFIKLRSISSPLTLTDQSVTLLGGTIALGLKCSGITLSPEWLDGLLDVCISSNPLHTRLLNQLIWWHVGRTQVSFLCEKKYCLYLFQFLSVQIPAWFSVASYLVHISYSCFRMATTTEKVCIVSILWLPLAGSTLR